MKRNILYLVLISFSVIIASCNNQGSKNVADNAITNSIEVASDMENVLYGAPSWGNEKSVIRMTEPKAHSGEFASITNDTIQFSYLYSELLKNINDKTPKIITVKAWIYTTVPNPDISIICSVIQDQEGKDWKPCPLNEKIEVNKWTEVSCDFYFDENLSLDQEMRIYALNNSKQTIYVDDFTIVFNY